ncbi:tyrosine-type recombinase/integrase [Thiomicrospira cyclica]|uniref:Integrase family protein n=1 Tax=Thiomicrospira cyclica (strain DSM 14477 / JCM 11371 / ALM1) TaxID=717773 RepID=F6DCF0_THICA|nr:site-specific integrase [Thiomicrospira cyclica]AEG31536.1 integrase family protein [Thiomicrospira cyclica ALM1]
MTTSNGTITPRKSKHTTRFNAQKQYKGIRYSKLFDTKADAQEWLDDLSYLGATDSAGNPTRKAKAAQMIIDEIDQQRARNITPTLKDCINIFARESNTASVDKYAVQLGRFSELLLKPINEITRLDFELEIRRIRRERKLTPSTANRYQAAFSSLFKFLAAHDDFLQYGLVNPTKDVPRGKEGAGRMLFLDKAEQVQLLQACKESGWSGLYLLVYMLLLTGSRRNEIARLRWENVDLKEGIINLVGTKNGTDHAIKLPPSAITMLKQWKLSQPVSHWVFQHRTDPRRPMTNFDHYWREAKRAAKMPEDLRVHDLRHTTASTMLADGYTLEQIKATLNHKSVMMTNRYAHALGITDTVASRDIDFLQGAM